MLTTDRLLDELVLHTTAFADAVHAADPAVAVPTCPGWTVADLVEHVGRTHRWAATTVERAEPRLASRSTVTDTEVPDTADGRSTWLLAGAARVAEAVRSAEPDGRVGGFGETVPPGFWARRQAHETLVHRYDAEVAVGVAPWSGVAADLAADGLSELLELLTLRVPEALRGTGQTLHLHATDDEAGEWVVTREGDGVRVEHGHRKCDVAVRGPATSLLAVLTRRADPADTAEVLGDGDLLAHWLEHTAF